MGTWKGYKLERIPVLVGNTEFRIDKVKNIDAYFDQFLRENKEGAKDDKIPYWADLWPSAIALAQYLKLNIKPGTLSDVVEIGCGLGLPGIVAHSLGADVLFTDHLQEPLEFLRHNWALNYSGSPKTLLFDWTESLSFEQVTISAKRPELIIASDIAYERNFHKPLWDFIKEGHSHGIKFILSEPGRELARDFLHSLGQIAPQLKRSQIIVDWKGIKQQVNIIEIQPE